RWILTDGLRFPNLATHLQQIGPMYIRKIHGMANIQIPVPAQIQSPISGNFLMASENSDSIFKCRILHLLFLVPFDIESIDNPGYHRLQKIKARWWLGHHPVPCTVVSAYRQGQMTLLLI